MLVNCCGVLENYMLFSKCQISFKTFPPMAYCALIFPLSICKKGRRFVSSSRKQMSQAPSEKSSNFFPSPRFNIIMFYPFLFFYSQMSMFFFFFRFCSSNYAITIQCNLEYNNLLCLLLNTLIRFVASFFTTTTLFQQFK